jgi:hypothetical protein
MRVVAYGSGFQVRPLPACVVSTALQGPTSTLSSPTRRSQGVQVLAEEWLRLQRL